MTGPSFGRRPSRPARVTITSPQTRIALAGRRPSATRTAPLSPDELRTAVTIRSKQLRRAVIALAVVGLFLVGTPLLIAVAPALTEIRFAGIPVSWLAVGVLPYPALAGIAWWQLRHAERIERREQATP